VTQKDLAPQLGIDPTTLNNFLTGESKALGGLAVALTCTIMDVECDGKTIGKIKRRKDQAEPKADRYQLQFEFDHAFQLQPAAENPVVVLRKAAPSRESVRVSIKRIG
jgi:hypothetical protein